MSRDFTKKYGLVPTLIFILHRGINPAENAYGNSPEVINLNAKNERDVNWKLLILSIAIPIVGGTVFGLLSMDGMKSFSELKQPPLSPPSWLFPVVWTILYGLMGISSYLVKVSDSSDTLKTKSLTLYGIQLAFNFLWVVWFFNLENYYFSFAWLVALWVMILITIILFYKSSHVAAYLMIPYLLWVTFAGYLNLGVAILN